MAKANHVCTTPADPIHLAIERHKTAVRLWAAAVAVSAAFPDGANPMTIEQAAQIAAAVAGARLPLLDAGLDLIETAPTTLEGIVAALEYMHDQMLESGAFMPSDIVLDTSEAALGGTVGATVGWLDIFVDTLADASRDLLAPHQEGGS
jgi:hypothetical protein